MKNTFLKKFLPLFLVSFFALSIFISCSDDEKNTQPDENVSDVIFTPPSGAIESGTEVTFSCETEGVTFYYSVNKPIYGTTYKNAKQGTSFTFTEELLDENSLCAVYVFAEKNGSYSKRGKAEYTLKVAPKPASENTALYLGNPSGAKTDVTYPENYLMEKSTYALSYNNKTHNPNWVSWHLDSGDLGDNGRGEFIPDEDLPSDWYRVKKEDYYFNTYGFSRGHMCPSMHRQSSEEENAEVFLMTNMVPQSQNNNGGVWNDLELQEKLWAQKGKELYIICGPYGSGGTTVKDSAVASFNSSKYGNLPLVYEIPLSGGNGSINVPASTWRIVIVMDAGTDDISRITVNTTIAAINVPNTYECLYNSNGKKLTWTDYLCTVDDIESLTGYDFFANLPDEIEDVIEAKKYRK
ncbi:MAG: DNA/RNA non-specific endonuclease [Treponema sp.]|nr:DNA/RNA non-specific endonuclease [Treponema sp.]